MPKIPSPSEESIGVNRGHAGPQSDIFPPSGLSEKHTYRLRRVSGPLPNRGIEGLIKVIVKRNVGRSSRESQSVEATHPDIQEAQQTFTATPTKLGNQHDQ